MAVFLIVAVATSAMADLSRLRTVQAEESDLTADMARMLLYTDDLPAVLPTVAQRIAQSLELPDAVIHLAAVPGDDRYSAFPLRAGAARLGTLLVPVDVPEPTMQRLQERVVPSLASLLHAGCERAAVLDSLETSRDHSTGWPPNKPRWGGWRSSWPTVAVHPDVFEAIATELPG